MKCRSYRLEVRKPMLEVLTFARPENVGFYCGTLRSLSCVSAI